MQKKNTILCPICNKITVWKKNSVYRPFCSLQCKLIDFNEWINEKKYKYYFNIVNIQKINYCIY